MELRENPIQSSVHQGTVSPEKKTIDEDVSKISEVCS